MKDEIKEILDYFRTYATIKEADMIKKIYNYITNLQEKLKVSQTNEETYRLEMQDITKILGLDEHTTFDEVKEYATNLQEENDILKRDIEAMKHNSNLLVRLIENGESMTQKFENGLTYQDYKSRNEKAIEYIGNGNLGIPRKTRDKFIAILKGEYKE